MKRCVAWMNSSVILFGGLSAATAGLGIWQLKRYYWKIDLIKHNEELFHMPLETIVATDYRSLSKKFEEMKGRKIALHGVYDHSKEVLLGPRAAPGLINKKAQGMATNPMGFYVITPLYLNNGTRVFVNRGWMPKNCKEWSHPPMTQLCVGIVQDWERKSTFTPDNDPSSGKLLWLDGNSIRVASDLKSPSSESPPDEEIPLLLERLEDSPESSLQNLQENEKFPLSRNMDFLDHNYFTPEVHFAYSVTWFSLAIAAAVIARFGSKSKRRINIFK